MVDTVGYNGIRQAKEEIGSTQPRWSRSLEGLDTLGRLGLEGLLLFMYPNYILVDYLPLGVR